ncbi:4Fe-4S binding protein [bacterium]|nr:4Fe-4S binding protein [bacterium]
MADNRRKIIINPDKCDLCGTCVGVCPEDAIILYEYTITVDDLKCTGCGLCAAVCPVAVPEVVSGND